MATSGRALPLVSVGSLEMLYADVMCVSVVLALSCELLEPSDSGSETASFDSLVGLILPPRTLFSSSYCKAAMPPASVVPYNWMRRASEGSKAYGQ